MLCIAIVFLFLRLLFHHSNVTAMSSKAHAPITMPTMAPVDSEESLLLSLESGG